MADVSSTGEFNRATAREPDERAGLGLLSRFLGAVFLVLVSGLFLLDRALLRANESQATLDAQSSVLLIESFLASRAVLLDRIGDLPFPLNAAKDTTNTAAVDPVIEALLRDVPDIRYVWKTNAGNTWTHSTSPVGGPTPLLRAIQQKLDSAPSFAEPMVQVTRTGASHVLISLVRGNGTRAPLPLVTTGITFDGNAIRTLLTRVQSGSRATLVLTSGTDTISAIGQPGSGTQALAAATSIVHLSSGGTWTLTATHALTTRSIRWALWALGILGALSLAYGLLREQQRAIQANIRSHELERLYSDVKRANQAKSEFLANVSHELRTPLNAIVGFVELLREGFYGDLSLRQVAPVDRIAASATHLRHLVDQVLDIAKIAAGRLEVHAEPMVLRPFVLQVASELESLMSEKKLSFSITVGASLPRVRTDPTHVRQILINLIGNAVKFTPAGTISVRARLADPAGSGVVDNTRKDGTWIALQVVDTGVGIAKADQERIFDEFEQVDAGPRGDSMNRGTGLGLPISRRLARLLGGDLSVESELGRGSAFTVWLPVNAADLAQVTPVGNDVDVQLLEADPTLRSG